ncbi:MAG: nucleotidyltransferase domain-containing protein [archaeon]
MDKVMRFNSKAALFEYICKKFSKSQLILVRGSTASGKIKNFSDIDVEIYGKKAKPYYEFVLFNNKLVLISVQQYTFVSGKEIKSPRGVRVLKGELNDKIRADMSKDRYNLKEKIKRECQLTVDFLLKYLRSGNLKYLKCVQKRIK